jgi:hypothetical protein
MKGQDMNTTTNTSTNKMDSFYLGGQLGYVQKGRTGIWVHDDMGSAVLLKPEPQYNWVEFAIDGVVIKSGVGH